MKIIVGLIVAICIIIFGYKSCSNDVGQGVDAIGDAVSDAGESLGDAGGALGAFLMKKLPNGVTLKIPSSGVESQLLAFVSGDQAVDNTTWFDFDRVTFESGSATLSAESMEQIKNIAEIMGAYDAMKVKIGGYTDNTGGAEINKAVSLKRANAVKAALQEMGVDQGRMASEGFGDANPIASNDTEEGRAQNRRMSLRVTAK